ncbi:MAG: magnesium chelatase ATPase subunit I [Betaproteobacteria bacterium TMED82]|nr:MAG: magnesium chelatase ATPase subunit I [Betaproteobacteria bacterium TMED82]
MTLAYPFTAIVGQEEMLLALKLSAIDPSIGGVLIMGDRGTGKSTAVRALAKVLPPIKATIGCKFNLNCELDNPLDICKVCNITSEGLLKVKYGKKKVAKFKPVPVIDLPLGATEDRIVGCLDMQRALTEGVKELDPGLLASANRGYLYVDEVNLLEDHLVDLLIDVSASGVNIIEREGLSISHPAKFVIVGSGNPEEGDLRPQLLDRFGFSVEIKTPTNLEKRVEVIKRRQEFDSEPIKFLAKWESSEQDLAKQIRLAKNRITKINLPDSVFEKISELCIDLKTDGLRGELTLSKAARALAAYKRSRIVKLNHVREIATLCLRHRLRRDPLDETSSDARVKRSIQKILGDV